MTPLSPKHRFRGITVRHAVTPATMQPSDEKHPYGYDDELREFERNHRDDWMEADYREQDREELA